jgi:hypothetical protein
MRDTSYLAFKSAIMTTKKLADISTDMIVPTQLGMSLKEMQTASYVYSTERNVHTAFLKIGLAFTDQSFNKDPFFRSFDSFSARLKSGETHDEASNVDARLLSCSGASSDFACLVSLQFDKQPPLGSNLELKLGEFTKTVEIVGSTFEWQATTYHIFDQDIPWWIATSRVRFELQRPSWLVLIGAELLRGKSGESLLRVTLSNPTDNSATVQNLNIDAAAPVFSGLNCANGDVPQTVVLKWDLGGLSR